MHRCSGDSCRSPAKGTRSLLMDCPAPSYFLFALPFPLLTARTLGACLLSFLASLLLLSTRKSPEREEGTVRRPVR